MLFESDLRAAEGERYVMGSCAGMWALAAGDFAAPMTIVELSCNFEMNPERKFQSAHNLIKQCRYLLEAQTANTNLRPSYS